MNASNHRHKKRIGKNLSLPAACGYAMLVFIGSAIILLFTAALITYSQKDPARFSVPAALIALYLSAMIGGMSLGRTTENPVISGCAYGAGCVLLTLFISLLPLGTATCGFGFLPSVLARSGIAGAALIGVLLCRKRSGRHTFARRGKRRH